jgi:hypothetical protein
VELVVGSLGRLRIWGLQGPPKVASPSLEETSQFSSSSAPGRRLGEFDLFQFKKFEKNTENFEILKPLNVEIPVEIISTPSIMFWRHFTG